ECSRSKSARDSQCDVRRPFRQNRSARRQAVAEPLRGDGEERRAHRRFASRPRNRPRAARFYPRQAALSGSYRFWGIACALAGTIAFAFRPVLIKLGYSAHPVSATTLLFLRMTLSLPFFLAMAWSLRGAAPLARRDWIGIAALGFLGYYLASLLDFLGLQYVSAGLGRLIMFLYPTLVVLLSALFLGKSPTRREVAALAITYAGIALVLSQQLAASAE